MLRKVSAEITIQNISPTCHLIIVSPGYTYVYYESKLFAELYYADPVNTSVWAVWAEQHAQ